jgi:hypothetical protein
VAKVGGSGPSVRLAGNRLPSSPPNVPAAQALGHHGPTAGLTLSRPPISSRPPQSPAAWRALARNGAAADGSHTNERHTDPVSPSSRDTTWIGGEFDRRAATYDHSEMHHRWRADQAVQLLQPQVGPKLSVSLRMPDPWSRTYSAGVQDGASDASRTPELVRGSELGADATQIGKTRLSRLLLPRQSAPAGSRIHVDGTIRVPGAAVWCCRSVDFAPFVLAGSLLVVAMTRRERR